MFDSIKVATNHLGLSKEESLDIEHEGYVNCQTKTFYCVLGLYEIDKEGNLFYIRNDYDYDSKTYDKEPYFYTGIITFYEYSDTHVWYEWLAKFHGGKMVSIRRLK